jgi:cyanate lyase
MIYQKEAELLERKTRLGLTHRDLANALQMPPSTIANKLAGFIPLSNEERKRLEKFLSEREAGK